MIMAFETFLVCIIVLGILMIPAYLFARAKLRNWKLFFTAYLFVLIILARLFVGLQSCAAEELEISNLGGLEKFFDSIVHALQTFSMDEDYTGYLVAGKNALTYNNHPVWAQAYGIIMSILNVCAPVLGGALLLDILAGIFPKFRIYAQPRRHKFVFSELNDASITLAEDLAKEENYSKFVHLSRMERAPSIIFTDAYPDVTSEPRSELFERAAKIHAICVKTDLLHLSLHRSKSVSYFLMDQKAGENISTIARLLQKEEANGRYLWPFNKMKMDTEEGDKKVPDARIYIFTREDEENEIIWRICRKMGEDSKSVLVRPIRDYMNTASCLMHDAPLFLPLLSDAEKQDGQQELHVSIIGSGAFAEEVLKAAFWCGQIQGVQLYIDVLAKDADALRRRIMESCPEMMSGCMEKSVGHPAADKWENQGAVTEREKAVRPAGEAGGDRRFPLTGVLTIDPNDASKPLAPPYCIFRFINVDDPLCCTVYPSDILARTDYFVVALGEDARNLKVTETIRKNMVRRANNGGRKHAVIAPVIYNMDLSELTRNTDPVGPEPYVLPFADLVSRFSFRNVLMDSFLPSAEKDAELYDIAKQQAMEKDEYSYWANLTRVVHYPYKLFGLGIVEGVDLRAEGGAQYRIKAPRKVTEAENELLAWVEHRRWNAYLRSQGFSCPTEEQFDMYYKQHCEQGNSELYKDVGLKFHPCLVERSMEATKPLPGQEVPADLSGYDRLDLVCIRYHVDYKQFDYKEFDNDLKKYLQ